MVNIITILIVVLNISSILVLVNMLKGVDLKFRIISVVILILINLLLSNIICSIGQMSVESMVANASKPMLLFSILPINLIVIASPIAVQMSKVKTEEIGQDKFIRNIIICLLIDIIIIVLECNYIKNIVAGIANFAA